MLYDKLTPAEYLGFVAGLWRIPPAEAAPEAERLLRWLELWEQRDTRCEGFSRGMKQKVALAGAMIHRPRLLILDEPLTGLDATMARAVKDALRAAVDARRRRDRHHPYPRGRRAAGRPDRHHRRRQAAGRRHARRIARPGRLRRLTLEDAFIRLTGGEPRRNDLVMHRLTPGGFLWLMLQRGAARHPRRPPAPRRQHAIGRLLITVYTAWASGWRATFEHRHPADPARADRRARRSACSR